MKAEANGTNEEQDDKPATGRRRAAVRSVEAADPQEQGDEEKSAAAPKPAAKRGRPKGSKSVTKGTKRKKSKVLMSTAELPDPEQLPIEYQIAVAENLNKLRARLAQLDGK